MKSRVSLKFMLLGIALAGAFASAKSNAIPNITCPKGNIYKCAEGTTSSGDHFIAYKGEGETITIFN